MEKLVSVWSKDQQSLPESYIFPPEMRPGKSIIPSCTSIPVIDLSQASDHQNRSSIVQQVLKASKDFGFFQVINHEVPEKLINDTMHVFKEFFDMPVDDKVSFYCENPSKSCRLYTSSLSYDREEIHLWRDSLRHPCHPLNECIQDWPEKPSRYREVVGAYSIEAKKLGSIILELIAEGLGLESGYFMNQLSENSMLSINHYPPCPDPSLTLGLVKHCDPNLITILLQGEVSGLQVLNDEEWMEVEPLPNAFVINIGYIFQIITNNKLKSVEHRAVTNSSEARISAAFFINPANDCVIEPARALTDDDATNPAIYRAFRFKEFLMSYISNPEEKKSMLELYMRQA